MRSQGERRLVEYALSLMKDSHNNLLPIGDDAAAIPLNGKNALVLKTDFLAALTDVPEGMTPQQIGWKAVTMNVSDLAAKGATPIAFLYSLGLPGDYPFEDARRIISGIYQACSYYGASCLGGDTGEAEGLLVAGMAAGSAPKNSLMRRDGAKPGDILAVTGEFGYTPLGLNIILEGRKPHNPLDKRAVKSVYEPRARLHEGLALANSGTVTSSMDSSDGLAWSLHELAEASKVGFTLDALPVDQELENYVKMHSLDLRELVFNGGEEYELVLTIGPRDWLESLKAVEKVGGRLIRIGVANASRGELALRTQSGPKRKIEPRGYEHFRP